jgi:penicillin-binding protein 1A
VGGDDRDIHFDSMTFGQGAAAALPIYGKFMTSVYADPSLGITQEDQFDIPAGFDPCLSNDDMEVVDEEYGDSIAISDLENIID